jgi:hypothetical protein
MTLSMRERTMIDLIEAELKAGRVDFVGGQLLRNGQVVEPRIAYETYEPDPEPERQDHPAPAAPRFHVTEERPMMLRERKPQFAPLPAGRLVPGQAPERQEAARLAASAQAADWRRRAPRIAELTRKSARLPAPVLTRKDRT